MKRLLTNMNDHLNKHHHKLIALAVLCKVMILGVFTAFGIQAIQNSYAQTITCGDGKINQTTEYCDDGNTIETDGCDNKCQLTRFTNAEKRQVIMNTLQQVYKENAIWNETKIVAGGCIGYIYNMQGDYQKTLDVITATLQGGIVQASSFPYGYYLNALSYIKIGENTKAYDNINAILKRQGQSTVNSTDTFNYASSNLWPSMIGGTVANMTPIEKNIYDRGMNGMCKTYTSKCGNEAVEITEECDGTNLNQQSCTTLGYQGGTLSCSSACTFTTTSCTQAPKIFTIEATAGIYGKISPTGKVSVEEGKNSTFTITPDTNYIVEDVKINGKSIGAVTSYTFENITSDQTISATFKCGNLNLNTTKTNETAKAYNLKLFMDTQDRSKTAGVNIPAAMYKNDGMINDISYHLMRYGRILVFYDQGYFTDLNKLIGDMNYAVQTSKDKMNENIKRLEVTIITNNEKIQQLQAQKQAYEEELVISQTNLSATNAKLIETNDKIASTQTEITNKQNEISNLESQIAVETDPIKKQELTDQLNIAKEQLAVLQNSLNNLNMQKISLETDKESIEVYIVQINTTIADITKNIEDTQTLIDNDTTTMNTYKQLLNDILYVHLQEKTSYLICSPIIKEEYIITVALKAGKGKWTPANDKIAVKAGEDVTIEFIADAGYTRDHIDINNNTVSYAQKIIIPKINQDYTINAYFKEGSTTTTTTPSGGGGGGGGSTIYYQQVDNCPLGDLSSSKTDGKCTKDAPLSCKEKAYFLKHITECLALPQIAAQTIKLNDLITTKIKAIDSMTPIGRGQRELIIGDKKSATEDTQENAFIELLKQAGKQATILSEQIKTYLTDLIMRRPPGREAYPGDIFYRSTTTDEETINEEETNNEEFIQALQSLQAKTSLIYGQMNEPPGNRARP